MGVQRVNTNKTTDLSGRWNDTDARLVADEMITDLVNSGWLETFRSDNDKNPIVIIGNVRNASMEHIDTDVFTKDLEREMINSGRITFVASPEERRQIRNERQDQQDYSSFDSAKRLANELGADFMMIGNISSIIDKAGGQAAVFYTVNLELINVENNTKVWIGNKKIKKLVDRAKLKM
jgi:uncharacterized protein (TIGR02722 family)